MPQALVAAGMSTFWANVVYYAAVIGITYSNSRQRRKARQRARDQYNDSLQDRLNMVSTADGARSRVYGLVRNVDGVLFKGTHGANKEFYTLVVALAGHECESIEKVYFNDQELELESDGAGGYWVITEPYRRMQVFSAQVDMTNGGGGASVTLPFTPIADSLHGVVTNVSPDIGGPTYGPGDFAIVGSTVSLPTVDPTHVVSLSYQYYDDRPKARVWKYLGTSGQDIGSDLLASRFPTLINTGTNPSTGSPNDDRFAGICCLVVELEFDQDAFPTGVPSVTALIKGAKIYDPRTGLTAWSQNPALIARDWSLYAYGGGCASGELVEAAFLAAANACDVSTGFVTPAGTETRPLYQCDIVCKLDSPPDQGWLAEIVESMAGKWGWAGGQLTVVAGVYRTPVDTITEDWISNAADISLVKEVPINDAVNVYRPTIANADAPVNSETKETAAYAMAAMPAVSSAAYIAADGMELPREIALGGVTHNVHAQHICGVFLRDARYGMTLSLPCKMHAWRLELFDVVYVTLPIFGFVAKQFEVVGWQFSAEKGVTLTLKQIDAAIFDPAASFDLPNAALNSTLVLPWIVPDVENFAVEDAPEDGTQQSRALVSWDAITAENVRQSGNIEVQYREVTDTYSEDGWNSWLEAGSATSTVITGLRSGVPYLFRARAVNTLGVRGAWCNQTLLWPSVPLIETGQLASSSVTEVLLADVASDSHTAAASSVTDRVLATLSYANDTGGPVTLELSLTSQRRVTVSGGYAGSVRGATFYIGTHTSPVYGGGSGTVGPPYSGLLDTPALTAGQAAQWSEAVVWSFDLEDGEELEMSSYCRLYPNFGSGNVTVDSYNVNHRMTVIKR